MEADPGLLEAMPALKNSSRFRVYVPIADQESLYKSKREDARWIVEGVASTEDKDLQNEIVVQKGIDFEPLKRSGYINWNHMEGPENILGIPLDVKLIEGPKLFIRGELLPEMPRAQAVKALAEGFARWNKAHPNLPPRRLGWSIEGEKVEMDGPFIIKCVVDMMAITHEPVNPETFLDLVRSLRRSTADTSGLVGGGEFTEEQLRKAMSTVADAPLDNQMLDDGSLWLWGPCEHEHYHPRTLAFKSGIAGAMEHLVVCKHMDPAAARHLLVALRRAY